MKIGDRVRCIKLPPSGHYSGEIGQTYKVLDRTFTSIKIGTIGGAIWVDADRFKVAKPRLEDLKAGDKVTIEFEVDHRNNYAVVTTSENNLPFSNQDKMRIVSVTPAPKPDPIAAGDTVRSAGREYTVLHIHNDYYAWVQPKAGPPQTIPVEELER